MLQGISSCIRRSRVGGHGLPWLHPWKIYRLCLKDYSAGKGGGGSLEPGPVVDQSFTATNCAADGRKFEFATVVVRCMKKGQSSVKIWQQACSLLTTNSPSLAVAFVSKPTESALRAVQELAVQLAVGQGTPLSPSKCSRTTSDSGQGSRNLFSGGTPPLIGCIMEDLGGDYEFSAAGPVGSTGSESQQGFSNSKLVSTIGSFAFNRDGQEAQVVGDRGKMLDPGVGALEHVSGSGGIQLDDEDVDEATLSDWEGVCSEFMEEASRAGIVGLGQDSEDELDPLVESPALSAREGLSKEGLLSFLNALKKPANSLEEPRTGGDGYSTDKIQSSDVMLNRKMGEVLRRDREGVLVGDQGPTQGIFDSGLGQHPAANDNAVINGFEVTEHASHGGLGRDGQGSFVVETWSGGDKAGVEFDPIYREKADADYKLVLCVGHMPGAKAVPFYSSTTGLPRLPDLEEAVTLNNPHMLLLGAPGFVFPEFIQRLSTVFPASSRAGAFLAPLFTSKRSQWTRAVAEQKSGPLFFGTKISTCGVVGLAISAKDNGAKVPVAAFAEFVRMSIAVPRIPGFIFLDEPISKNLFLPKNATVHHSARSSSNDTARRLMLDHLSTQLLRESTVPCPQQVSTIMNKMVDPNKKGNAVDGVSEKYMSCPVLPSRTGQEDAWSSENLPLALFDSVLFPGWSMPFHIFEPCYRFMVRRCLEQGKPFGLSTVHNGSWAVDATETGEIIGTVAFSVGRPVSSMRLLRTGGDAPQLNLRVHSFQRDFRSYIIAHGVRRFRVVNERIWAEPGSFGLTMGQVQYFDDEKCKTAEEKVELLDLAKQAVSLCVEVISEASSAPGLVKSTHDPTVASFAIGHIINVPTRVKRRWLKMVNTKTRLLEQIAFLETGAAS